MGWLYYHREKGESNFDHFSEKMDDSSYKLLDCATVGGTIYAAVRGPRGVEAGVILTRWVPNDEFNFGYKDMTESMGPTESNCPARILNQLDSVVQLYGAGEQATWAAEWRLRCQTNIERRAAAKAVTPGTRVRFPGGFEFRGGGKADTFEFVKRSTFRAAFGLCRIPRWKEREFEILGVTG